MKSITITANTNELDNSLVDTVKALFPNKNVRIVVLADQEEAPQIRILPAPAKKRGRPSKKASSKG
ncbi:MAG: hypothetical protein JST83_12460 [Bacteroidetes bacterium]|nr:hypothetical protein [Bacteroidota bacterium]